MNIKYPREDCWICESVSSLEAHHIVPKAYGGTNGPLCLLCSTCHSAVHKFSYSTLFMSSSETFTIEQIMVKATFYQAEWDIIDRTRKGFYLSDIIYKARELTKNEDRKVKSVFSFDLETKRRLKVLRKAFNVSQEKVVTLAIHELYIKKIGDV